MKLYIKNMVCDRCITVVRGLLEDNALMVKDIKLGEVTVEPDGTIGSARLSQVLESHGFELIDDTKSQLINKVKSLIISRIRNPEQYDNLNQNISTFLETHIETDYNYLSHHFSTMEGRTIERYFIAQKIEFCKELLIYNELTLSEIAWKLEYSSVQYLSNQFKKEVGMTPSEFKSLNTNDRRTLDKV